MLARTFDSKRLVCHHKMKSRDTVASPRSPISGSLVSIVGRHVEDAISHLRGSLVSIVDMSRMLHLHSPSFLLYLPPVVSISTNKHSIFHWNALFMNTSLHLSLESVVETLVSLSPTTAGPPFLGTPLHTSHTLGMITVEWIPS